MSPRGDLVEPLVAHLLAEMPGCRAWEREFPRGDPAARDNARAARQDARRRTFPPPGPVLNAIASRRNQG